MLTAAALTACRDSDKVQVNAIRALGNLLAIECPAPAVDQQPADSAAAPHHCPGISSEGQVERYGQASCSDDEQASTTGSSCDISHGVWWGVAWLDQGIESLVSSLSSSTDKVWFCSYYFTCCLNFVM